MQKVHVDMHLFPNMHSRRFIYHLLRDSEHVKKNSYKLSKCENKGICMSAVFQLVCVCRICFWMYEFEVYACDVCGGMLGVMNIYIYIYIVWLRIVHIVSSG